MHFVCPKCKNELNISDNRAVCSLGHSFDKAREGYYNLLLSLGKGVHGDNKEMVLARRVFLSSGHYERLARRVAELSRELTPHGGKLLDAGAGEGYYTDFVERELYSRDRESDVSAFDISKDAVKQIAKKNPRITLAVAGSYHIPAGDNTFDTVINTFSPLALEETHRVLKEGGVFIMAIPGEEHLFELKSLIYDTPYKNAVKDTALPGFELILDEPIKYTMDLSGGEEIRSLFMMTPYAYRTRPQDKERVESCERLSCTADFRIFVYRKKEI